jgi:hypothetical protein
VVWEIDSFVLGFSISVHAGFDPTVDVRLGLSICGAISCGIISWRIIAPDVISRGIISCGTIGFFRGFLGSETDGGSDGGRNDVPPVFAAPRYPIRCEEGAILPTGFR